MKDDSAMTLAAAGGAPNRPWPLGLDRRWGAVGTACLGPLLVVAICALRSPAIMAQGHLWAEDAFFLSHMLDDKHWLSRLFFVYNGHIELLNNVVFALAAHLKLKLVPLATSYCALLIECLLTFVVVYFRKDLELRLAAAILIGMLIVVSPCASENHLTMLNSVWVTSALLLVVINLPPSRLQGHGLTVAATSLILGLSGIPATSLMPVAALYAVAWRSRPHLLIAAMLLVCGLVQGGLVLTHGTEHRFGSVSPWVYLAAPFFHVVVEHLLGVEAASALDHFFQQSIADTAAFPTLAFAPLALAAWMAVHMVRGRDSRSRLLLAAFVYVVVFNISFAIGDRNDLFSIYDMRYFFVPAVALALLLGRESTVSGAWPSRAVLGLMVFATVVSAGDFFADGFNGMYVAPQRDWRQDVGRCEAQDGPCRIAVDPGGWYAVDVPARARP